MFQTLILYSLYIVLFIILFKVYAIPSINHDPKIINNLFGRDKSPNPAIESYSGCSLITKLDCPSHSDSDIQMGECWSNARVMGQRSAFFTPFPPGHKSYNSEGGPYGDCIAYSCYPKENQMKLSSNLANLCFFWDGKVHTSQLGGGIISSLKDQSLNSKRDLSVSIGSSSPIVKIGNKHHDHHNKIIKGLKKVSTKKSQTSKKPIKHHKDKGHDGKTNTTSNSSIQQGGDSSTMGDNSTIIPPSSTSDPNQQQGGDPSSADNSTSTIPTTTDPNKQTTNTGNDNSTSSFDPPESGTGDIPVPDPSQANNNTISTTTSTSEDPNQESNDSSSNNPSSTNNDASDPTVDPTTSPNANTTEPTATVPSADPTTDPTTDPSADPATADPSNSTSTTADPTTTDPTSVDPTSAATSSKKKGKSKTKGTKKKKGSKKNKKAKKKTKILKSKKVPKKPKSGGSGGGGGGSGGQLPKAGHKEPNSISSIPKAPGKLIIPMPMICPSNLENCYSQNYFEPGGKLENYANLKPTYQGLWVPPKIRSNHQFLFCFGLNLGCPTPSMRDLQLHRIANQHCDTSKCKKPSEPIKK